MDARDTGDVLAQLRAAREAVVARLATLDRLTLEAAHRVYSAESTDGAVVANVDGNGQLLDLAVDPAAFRVAHPEHVGPQIVAAIAAARRIAAGERAEQVRKQLQLD